MKRRGNVANRTQDGRFILKEIFTFQPPPHREAMYVYWLERRRNAYDVDADFY